MLTRRQLLDLGRAILSEGDPERLEALIEAFDRAVPHPAASDLFLFPELTFGEHAPSVEEIVDAALTYRDPTLMDCERRRRLSLRGVRPSAPDHRRPA